MIKILSSKLNISLHCIIIIIIIIIIIHKCR